MPRGSSAVAIIPARLGSTRFPAKVLKADTGKPLVVHVCERAADAELVSRVVVATDSDEVASAVRAHGFEVVMTSPEHPNGTSRLVEAAQHLRLDDREVVVNVQGDEPEVPPALISAAVEALSARTSIDRVADHSPGGGERFQWVGTVASPFHEGEDPSNPNIVKAVVGLPDPESLIAPALVFTRSVVPYPRHPEVGMGYLKHVGLYSYSVAALRHYLTLPPTPLERTESLEQLRWLEHAYPIAVAIRDSSHTGIDTPDQYAAFVARFRASGPA